MYRLLKPDAPVFNSIRRHAICDLCFPPNQNSWNVKLRVSYSTRIQYKSAIKHLLRKKKMSKSKNYVEVLQKTEKSMKNIRASVDVMRGKQLTVLTTQLTSGKQDLQLSHRKPFSSAFLQSTERIRHYEPLLVLPLENFGIETKLGPKVKDLEQIKADPVKLEEDRVRKLDLKRRLSYRIPDGANPIVVENETVDATEPENIFEAADKAVNSSEEMDGITIVEHPRTKFKAKVPKTSVRSLKKKTREDIAQKKMTDLQRQAKQEALDANFLSFVDACGHSNMVEDAFSALKSYHWKCKFMRSWNPPITNIEVYNTIMAAYAKRRNWLKIKTLQEYARKSGVSLNAQSFAIALECLARRKSTAYTEKYTQRVRNMLLEMESLGISIDTVLTTTNQNPSDRELSLSAVRLALPDFTPQSAPLDVDYKCSLLDHLNHEDPYLVSPVPDTFDFKILKKLYRDQMNQERNNYVKIKTVEKRTEDPIIVENFRRKLDKSEKEWRATVETAFDRDLELLRLQSIQKSNLYFSILPYLLTLPKQELVDIVMREIRKLAEGSETYSPTTRQLYRELGNQVYLRYQIRKKADSGALQTLGKLYKMYLEWYLKPDDGSSNSRQKWQQLLSQHSAEGFLCSKDATWKGHVLAGVGQFLYNIIIRDVKVNVNILREGTAKEHYLPAFYTLFRTKGHISKEELKPHPVLSRLYRAAAPEHLVFEAAKIPMICPPLPWTSITSGGNLVTKTELIRLPYQAIAQWKELEASPTSQLYPPLDSLNQLGAVPWTVNEQVLDVILEVFTNGGSADLDVPEPPSACPAAPAVTADHSPQERSQIYRQRMAVRRRRAEMYSLWCDALYKLSLANHFRNQTFWLPHNMDFRGRVYPVAPHLNHLGSDLSRSLLVFAKGKPLGPEGFDWLKIHTINLTGTHKKQSIVARLEHANAIIEDIVDSANYPLTGRMWWKESEEPWQTLAACIEVRNAMASGDPSTYVSRFPVHQDGSCNGLQHYAALGRDQAGGESVNLTPADVPQDVYSCVAAIVERERANDAANGVEIAQQLDGFIQRKVIKQTVMTTVYGVTRFGARLQIARQLKDLNKFPKQHVWQASMYLVNKTFDSIQEMFTSTKEIQDWFTECARLIAQVPGENVRWVTPLGLPIVQPYSRTATPNTPDNFKFIGVHATNLSDAFERPNVMKQKNAFAPNFVHSLDSSHMMLTSISCERQGITFVSVHDCYWTHACSVPLMNRICRSQFVALHSSPILPNLSEYFVERFSYPEICFTNDGSTADQAKRNLNQVLQALPKTGDLNLSDVLKSPYFFS